MTNSQTCPQCNNTTFHFDRSRHAIVCDVCGWEQNAAEQMNEQFLYDQQRQRAIAYVRARDYNSAKPFLNKMREIKPDDPDIYYLHMIGLTDCCNNLLLTSSDRSSYELFEHYWRIYSSLSSDPGPFREYRRKRRAELLAAAQNSVYRFALLAGSCYFALLLSVLLVVEGVYWAILPTVVAIVLIYLFWPLSNLIDSFRNLKHLQRSQ